MCPALLNTFAALGSYLMRQIVAELAHLVFVACLPVAPGSGTCSLFLVAPIYLGEHSCSEYSSLRANVPNVNILCPRSAHSLGNAGIAPLHVRTHTSHVPTLLQPVHPRTAYSRPNPTSNDFSQPRVQGVHMCGLVIDRACYATWLSEALAQKNSLLTAVSVARLTRPNVSVNRTFVLAAATSFSQVREFVAQ